MERDDTREPIPIPETDEELLAQCRVDTFRSGGKGGQHQNVTDSGVRLTHLPSGVVTTSRAERSQHRNRALALSRLRKKLEALNRIDPERIPTKVPSGQKKRRLEEKRRRSRLKDQRKRLRPDNSEE